MPKIRYDFSNFVHLWNTYRIRKQKQCPYVHLGQPIMLYSLPDPSKARHCQVQVDQGGLDYLRQIVEQDGVDLDKFLPQETMEICGRLLTSIGGLPDTIPDQYQDSPYLPQYIALKKHLREYISSGQHPLLSLLPLPTLDKRALNGWMEKMGISSTIIDIDSIISSLPDDDITSETEL